MTALMHPRPFHAQRNALWLGFLMGPAAPAQVPVVNADMAVWMKKLPEWMQSPGKSHMPSVSKPNSQPTMACWWPSNCMSGVFEGLSAPGVLVSVIDANQNLCADEAAIHFATMHRANQWECCCAQGAVTAALTRIWSACSHTSADMRAR